MFHNYRASAINLTGKITWMLSTLQGLFPSSERCDLKFRLKISKRYIIAPVHVLEIILDLPFGFPINNIISLCPCARIFSWNKHFLSSFCFGICHLSGKSIGPAFDLLLIFSGTAGWGEMNLAEVSICFFSSFPLMKEIRLKIFGCADWDFP